MKLILILAILSSLCISRYEIPTFEYKPLRTQNLAFGEALDQDLCSLDVIKCQNEKTFTVSAFNTVEAQTDQSPCVSASGDNICGRSDVVACPRQYPLGTIFNIEGKDYVCLDRLAKKYDDRIDISFDKDIKGAKQWGVRKINITIK